MFFEHSPSDLNTMKPNLRPFVIGACICILFVSYSPAGTLTLKSTAVGYTSCTGGCSTNSTYFPDGVVLGALDSLTRECNFRFFVPPGVVGTASLDRIRVYISGKRTGTFGGLTEVHVGTSTVDLSHYVGDNEAEYEILNATDTYARSLLQDSGDGIGSFVDVKLRVENLLYEYDLKHVRLECTFDEVPDSVLDDFQTAYGAYRVILWYGRWHHEVWGFERFPKEIMQAGFTWALGQIPSIQSFAVNEVLLPGLGLKSLVTYKYIFALNSLNDLGILLDKALDGTAFQVTWHGPKPDEVLLQCNLAAEELKSLSEHWKEAFDGINADEIISVSGQIDAANQSLVELQRTLSVIAVDGQMGEYDLYDYLSNSQEGAKRARVLLHAMNALLDWQYTVAPNAIHYEESSSLLPKFVAALSAQKTRVPALAKLSVGVSGASGVNIQVEPCDLENLCIGSPKSYTYIKGSSVTLRAPTTMGNKVLNYWTGADNSNGGVAYVTMSGDRSVTAVYESQAVIVTINFPTSDFQWTTGSDRVYLHGTASVNAISVTWKNLTTGETGTAAGTATWDSGRVTLAKGENVILVTSSDGFSQGTDTITVHRTDLPTRQVVLHAVQDAYVAERSPTKNFGSGDIYLGYSTEAAYGSQRGLLRFDLSSLPGGHTVNSASIQLYTESSIPATASDLVVTASRLTGNWGENSVTWDTQPGFSQGESAAAVFTHAFPEWTAIDATQIVKAWASGSENYGVILISNKEGTGIENTRVISSRSDSRSPGLRIDYIPETEPPVLTITAPTANPVLFYTNAIPNIELSGSAFDNYEISAVTWANQATGKSGDAGLVGATWKATVGLNSGWNTVSISARDQSDNAASDIIDIYYVNDQSPPSKPQNLRVSLISLDEAILSWDASTDTGGSGFKDYVVYRNSTLLTNTSFTSLLDKELKPGTLYCYAVTATDNAGNTNMTESACVTVPVQTRVINLVGSLLFNQVVTNLVASRTIVISNNGNSALLVAGIEYPNGFTGNWNSGTISPGGSQPLTVTFRPAELKTYSGFVNVISDATDGDSTKAVSGTGVVAATRVIALSDSLAFGNVVTNTTAVRTLTITNTGNSTLSVSSISYPAGFIGAWSGSIAPEGKQDVAVTFEPLHLGDHSGIVKVNSDATSGVDTMNATGTGVLAATRVITLSDSLAFGNVVTNTTALGMLTITNTGNSTLTISNISFPVGFGGAWSGSLEPGEATNVIVVFEPSESRDYSGFVRVYSDATSGLDSVSVSGTGIGSAPPAPVIKLVGDLAFGEVIVGTTASRTLKVWNIGDSPLSVNSIAYPTGFHGPWSGTVSNREYQEVTVTFAPSEPVAYAGLVAVESDATGGDPSIPISGKGVSGKPRIMVWGDTLAAQQAVPLDVEEVVSIAVGTTHCLALMEDGTIRAWGDNRYGQTNVPPEATNVIAIAAGGGRIGSSFSVALKADGSLIGWGFNDSGQTDVPKGASGIVGIAAGGYHGVAFTQDGKVIAWGGDLPPGDATNVCAVSAGTLHTLALRKDGSVLSWGVLDFVPANLSNVVAVSAGSWHNLALRANGTVVAWGDNGSGQCEVPSNATNVVAIAAGERHSLALKADGRLVSWGSPFSGYPASAFDVVAIACAGDMGMALSRTAELRPRIWRPEHNGSHFSCMVPAMSRSSYTLQVRRDSESEWRNADQLNGNGANILLKDPSPPEAQALYRVLVGPR